jgi:structural maintenance of chromosome 2
VGKKNASLALSLVGYDKTVSKAMEFIFGRTFICNDSRSAEKVTFDKSIRTRSVTLQGDVFDAAGTLTGGSRQTSTSVLLQLQQLNEVRAKLAEISEKYAAAKEELDVLASAEDSVRELTMQKELVCHEIALLEARISNSSYGQLQRQVDELNAELETTAAAKQTASEKMKRSNELFKTLQTQINESGKEKKIRLKQMETEITKKKKTLKKAEDGLKKTKAAMEQRRLELQSLEEELDQGRATLAGSSDELEALRQAVDDAEDAAKEHQLAFDSASARLQQEQAKLAKTDQAMSALNKEAAALTKQIKENGLSIKAVAHKLDRMKQDAREAKSRVSKMLKRVRVCVCVCVS